MTILELIGYIGYVVGAVIILTSKTKSDNLVDLKERVAILEKEREYDREQHLENQRAIANLEGQLKTYKEIPLKKIAEALDKQAITSIEILATLQNSAIISANEARTGGMLVRNSEDAPLSVKPVK